MSGLVNKKSLTEADIRTKYITPAVLGPGSSNWDSTTHVRDEFYFTKGRVVVQGKTVKRGEAKKIDHLLFYKPNIPIAVIEAKDNCDYKLIVSCGNKFILLQTRRA